MQHDHAGLPGGLFGRKLARFRRGQKNQDNDVVSWGITVPVGWDSEHLTEDDLLWAGAGDCWKVPCDSVLKNIVIAPDGELVVCCGIGSDEIPETVVGNVRETPLIELISQANNDLIINWLALEGPFGIMKRVQRSGAGRALPRAVREHLPPVSRSLHAR